MKNAYKIIAASLAAVILLCIPSPVGGLFGSESRSVKAQTIMVYMIGSDLESREGIASGDMEEMLGSGVDTAEVNVVLLAGGSSRWQSDVSADALSTWYLGKSGWEMVEEQPAKSMGSPETLAEFLGYCYKGYPAQSYGLVLWDHGAGPMEGYGVDELFGSDSLSLSEMRSALEASPFSGDNMLEWIGFDACLMSSVETIHTVSDYAKYMIASQEAEPDTGWSYSFLGRIIGSEDGESIGRYICEDYYEFYEKKYAQYPASMPLLTISCVDTSAAAELESAVEGLGTELSEAISRGEYARLVRTRLDVKSFGRFTVGMEFDLIDLGDFAKNIKAEYPKVSGEIEAALEKLVICNISNITEASGLSIYFPCYNKTYFERRWETEYRRLGFSENYTSFLSQYAESWYSQTESSWSWDDSAQSVDMQTTGEYTVQLSDEQAADFAGASYYIIERYQGEQYQLLYSSPDVELDENGTLRAAYDGRSIYCLNAVSGKIGGVVHQRLVEKTPEGERYLIPAILSVDPEQWNDYSYFLSVWFQTFYSEADDSMTITGIIPMADEDSLNYGKTQYSQTDANTIQITNYPRYLTRDSDGSILPFWEWNTAGEVMFYEFMTSPEIDVVEFAMLDISQARTDLFVMFVVENSRGETFATELLQINSGEGFFGQPTEETWQAAQYVEKKLDFSFENQETSLLLEEQGVSVTLKSALETDSEVRLYLDIENGGDRNINLSIWDESVNGIMTTMLVSREDGKLFNLDNSIKPGETAEAYAYIRYEDLESIGQSAIDELEFSVKLTDALSGETLYVSESYCIDMSWDLSERVSLSQRNKSRLYDGKAVFFSEGIYASRIDVGEDSGGKVSISLYFENSSERYVKIRAEDISVNGYIVDGIGYLEDGEGYLPPGKKAFGVLRLTDDGLFPNGLADIEELECRFQISEYNSETLLSREVHLTDELMLYSAEEMLSELGGESVVIIDEGGVYASVREVATSSMDCIRKFELYLENESSERVSIKIDNLEINGAPANIYLSEEEIPPGKKYICSIYIRDKDLSMAGIAGDIEEISISFSLIRPEQRQLLHTTEPIYWIY